MDIIKTTKSQSNARRYRYLVLILLGLAAVVFFANRYRAVSYVVGRTSLLVETVNAGEFEVSVRGYGQLVSNEVYWIGAETLGSVSRILVRPGDRVEKDDVMIELVNPLLQQELKDMELEFAARQADMIASRINRESAQLDIESQAANADIDYQTAKMNYDAKAELMAKGQEVISRLEFESTRLSVQKFQQRLVTEQQRAAKSKEAIHATMQAEQARLEQSKNELQKLRDQVDALKVRATVSGIIQEMNLQLGQQIVAGTNVTRIARPEQLVAAVRIPELQVNDIQLGMSAKVDTRTNEIKGKVSRIDPAVIDGTVLVEIELLESLPSEARPDLNIEATILVSYVANTLHVRRPVFSRASTEALVYRLTEDSNIAEQIRVVYGEASSSEIEVIEGLVAGDKIIVSDSSKFNSHERILIR